MGAIQQVKNSGATGWTNAAIQKALDRCAGGTLVVPAGVYTMRDALHLRSGVRVVGEPGAVLRKAPSVSSRIVDYLGYGHYEITVAEPHKFRVGMGVHILDDKAFGFYTTVATITGISGNRLFLNRLLNHDYNPDANARAVSAFSLVEADGIADASLEGIVLDGNKDEETFSLNGCRGGAVFIYQSRRIALRGLKIHDYRGDAISFQQNVDITVSACHVHHNTGGGLHPGSGSVRYLLKGNHLHDNGGCGIFYCLRTTHSICRDNKIENNGAAGISIGERDTDHLVENNTILTNGGPGIHFRTPMVRSGDRVRLRGNTIGGNCNKDGEAEIEIAPGLRQLHITGNQFIPGIKPVISVGAKCEAIYIEGNTVGRRAMNRDEVAGQRACVKFAKPHRFPALGPAALPADGALHLHILRPGPCRLPKA